MDSPTITTSARIWNVTENNQILKVVTIEHGERSPNPMCEGCYAFCCRGTHPVLTADEFLNRKYKFIYKPAPDYISKFAPENKRGNLLLAVLAEEGDHCYYLDTEKLICKAWPDIPKACLSYDCRREDRPEFQAFCQQRTKEWMALNGRNGRNRFSVLHKRRY